MKVVFLSQLRLIVSVLARGSHVLSADHVAYRICGAQNDEANNEIVIDNHHGAGVVEHAAIVRRGEDGDQLAACEELVAILDNLMGATDDIDAHAKAEVAYHIGAEGDADAAIVAAPAHHLLVGIAPQQITDQTLFGYVAGSLDGQYVLEALQAGTEAAVHAKDAAAHQCSQRHAVVGVHKVAPELYRIPTLALVVEPVDAIDAGALVVAAQQPHHVWIAHLVGQQQRERLNGQLAAVHVIAQKQISGGRRIAARVQNPQ